MLARPPQNHCSRFRRADVAVVEDQGLARMPQAKKSPLKAGRFRWFRE
jgi:hypothetical protein